MNLRGKEHQKEIKDEGLIYNNVMEGRRLSEELGRKAAHLAREGKGVVATRVAGGVPIRTKEFSEDRGLCLRATPLKRKLWGSKTNGPLGGSTHEGTREMRW